MTDQPRTPSAGDPLDPRDPFERELRAILRDRAAGPVPVTLGAAVRDVAARPAPAPAARWRRPLTALLAAGLALLVLGMGFNPINVVMEAVVGPASRPSESPVPTLATPGFDLSSAMVGLTATDIQITAGGRPIPVPPRLRGSSDPGDQRYRSLQLGWEAFARGQALHLYFEANATDWWVSEARIYDNQASPDWIRFPGPLFTTPIGQAFRGDIALESDEGAVRGTITMKDAVIDPDGLGTGPRLFTDCVPPAKVDPAVLSSIRGTLDPARAGALIAQHDVCAVFRWTTSLPDGGSMGETWCVAPPSGTIRLILSGPKGELVVFVDDESSPHPPRRQPPDGWYCVPETVPDASPFPMPTLGPVDWSGNGVTLVAQDLLVDTGGALGQSPQAVPAPSSVTPTRRAIAPGWQELTWDWTVEGDPAHLSMRVWSDGVIWSVPQVRFWFSLVSDDPATWTDVPLGGRVGDAWSGDLVLAAGDATGYPARVRMPGLTFDPGVTAAILDPLPTPSPGPDAPIVFQSPTVRLEADDLLIQAGDRIFHGSTEDMQALTLDASLPTFDKLHVGWKDGDTYIQLKLQFVRNDQEWWISGGELALQGLGYTPLPGMEARTPLGVARTADLSWSSTLKVSDPRGQVDTEVPVTVTLRNARLQPFLGTPPSASPSPRTGDS